MIDEDILAKLIADKSGMSRQNAQKQLDELAAAVKSAVNEGEAFEIEHFGTFKKEQDTIVFVPDEVLQTEINQKYVGMRPIELMGSFRETVAAQPTEQVETAPPEPGIPMETAPKNGSEPPIEQSESAAIAEIETKEEQKESPRSAEKEIKKKAGAENETGLTSIILIVLAIIAALILAGWLLFDMGVISNNETSKPEAVNNPQAVSNKKRHEETEDLERASLAVSNTEATDKPNKANPTNEESVFGLRGEVQPEVKDSYTIIVHSLWQKKRALHAFDSLKTEGYRTVMKKARVNGRLYWRVGIGQFKTIKDAQKAIKNLPEPFKSNNFIKHQ